MAKKLNVTQFDDYDLLNWIHEQEFPWREGVYELSKAKSLEELVIFVRNNYQKIKQLQNEKTRINREA